MQASTLVAIAVAGALGSICRHLLGELVIAWCGAFPLHTLVVNVTGCLLFGVAWGYGSGRWPALVSVTVLVGFFGAFTTFSSFAHDCVVLGQARRFAAMALDVLAQNAVGLLAMWGGMVLGTRFGAA
jgi:CrcB protein